jgi:ribosomal protein L7/L12
MENLDPMGQWLLLGVVAWTAFMIGRATARGGGESREARVVRENEEIAAATAPVSQATWEEVDRLTAAGKKIEAIKTLREASGLGLKLAKDAVERRTPGV